MYKFTETNHLNQCHKINNILINVIRCTFAIQTRQSYSVVDDLLEVNGNRAVVDVRVVLAAVDEDADLLRTDLGRTVTEDEQHRIDDVRLAASIWSNDRRKALKNNKSHEIVLKTNN